MIYLSVDLFFYGSIYPLIYGLFESIIDLSNQGEKYFRNVLKHPDFELCLTLFPTMHNAHGYLSQQIKAKYESQICHF